MSDTKKQTILLVHNYYKYAGGEDTVVNNEKHLLENHGHRVYLYTRNNTDISFRKFWIVLFLPIITVFNPKTYFEIKSIIKKNKIDIIHVHNTLTLISPSIYYAAVKERIPIVQTLHNYRLICPNALLYKNDHICEECINKGMICAFRDACYRGSRIQTLGYIITILIHRKTGIMRRINYLCLTEFAKSKIGSIKNIQNQKLFVKPNFTFEDQRISNNPSRDFYIFVGRIEEIKGIRLLIDAFGKMPDRKLKVIGDGPLTAEMQHMSENNSNIYFCGKTSHNEVIKLISNAKALILPTRVYEGMPMTIIEAFSVKTPVIASNIGSCCEMITEGYNGFLFQYDSVNSLIDTICLLDKSNYTNLCDNALETYRKKYSPESSYKILKSIYDCIN